VRFAELGCKVVISDINKAGGEKVASSNTSSLAFHHSDVTKMDDWTSLLKFTVEKFGRLDILVNNAGTSYINKPTLEVTEAEFDRVFNVNVKSIYFSAQAIIPHLIKQGSGGSVINISSIGALRPRPGLVWYNASKGAVYNASKGLAGEYAPYQIRVNSILPLLSGTGLFSTFAGCEDTPENREKFLGNVPMGRLTDPRDVADACVYFASDESKFVTGTSLEVDGGRAIG
jgi:NAD(P)-dependent dehydrogenase (short-subunit alcohol dehydrogenase family)